MVEVGTFDFWGELNSPYTQKYALLIGNYGNQMNIADLLVLPPLRKMLNDSKT